MAVYNDKLKEHSVVDLLKRDLDEVQKALDNIMRAIEQGIGRLTLADCKRQ